MPGKRYVSLSALSGIFCRVGGKVLSPRGVPKLPILRHLRTHLSVIPGTVQQRIRRVHGATSGGAECRRLADIHSLDDRYDHDVDELMA